MSKKINPLLWATLAVVALTVGTFLYWAFSDAAPDRAAQMEKVRGEFAARKVNGSDWIAPPSKRPEVVKKLRDQGSGIRDQGSEVDEDELTEEEEKLIDTIHDALNEEDQELAIELAKRAVRSKKAEVRSEMVDTLRWFGDKVMPELMMFIDDPDEGVRIDAMAAYQQAIYDIEEDSEKAKIIEISMRNLSDSEALEEIASELIGMDDLLAVQTLINVIDGESKTGRRIAKETYETVTGEEYTTFEAAEAWLREQQEE